MAASAGRVVALSERSYDHQEVDEPRQPEPYVINGDDWDDYEPNPIGIGAGFYWIACWYLPLLSYTAMLYERPPFMDDPQFPADQEPDKAQVILSVGTAPLEILSVGELEKGMDLQLPPEIRRRLEDDRRRHFAGELGESPERIRARMTHFGRGGELRDLNE